ncbi:hypothetical protein DSO57_1011988 [Entomophthora muscae]|uniref:Uncharacterized protein n=1 Tax=Entomophthora muscae TaxID=34485 RepID=A0ACC2TGV6_9FUNG|nr:hypothetical protein DSO57_1011988 [Entomophthora muscae]
MQSQFEAIYLAHEHPSQGPRPMQGPYVFTGNCYNCGNQGHKSKRCTKPCTICKSTDHTNFSCNQHKRNTTQRPIAVMMADQYYQNEKRPLTTPESAFSLNKKNTPSPNQDYTPPPLKRHEREANPSPKEQPAESDTPATPETQSKVELYDETFEEGTHAPPTSPKLPTPPLTVCNSRWNPKHPNPFAALEEQLDFDNPALVEDNLRYNMVTVETAPESPANQNNATNSVELDLEIHNEFLTSNNEPRDATSAEGNVNNVYEGETTDAYVNTPMETSPLIKEESVDNPPMKTSSLIYPDSTANIPMETSTVEAANTMYNSPMDTFNTPAEMGLVDNNNLHLSNGEQSSNMNDDCKQAIPSIQRRPLDASNLKAERLVEGILVDKLFAETAVTISLADLLWESPKLQQKTHRAVSALQLHQKEEIFLAGTGAPRTEAAVNRRTTHVILDEGAYKTLPNVFIAPSDVTFIMADGNKKFCLEIAKGLNLWIGDSETQIVTEIFDHHKYMLLLGQQTMTYLGITTQYIGNKWTIEYNNLKFQLHVTFDITQITKFLCEPIETNISKNKWLTNDQKPQTR